MSQLRESVVPTVLKIVADAIMGALALVAAVLVDLLAGLSQGDAVRPTLLGDLGRLLGVQVPLLLVPMLGVYAAWGVYGRVRGMGLGRKALELAGAAALSFLVFGSLQALLPAALELPPDVLLGAFALEVLFVLGSRFWANQWRALSLAEAGLARLSRAAGGRKRVLVVGGGGYVGSALVPRLLEDGYTVRVLDLLLFGEEPLRPYLSDPNLELLRVDFRQVDQVVTAMRGVDTVVHLGGLVGDPACSVDPDLTAEVNVDYTRLIAEVAKGEGVSRFVFASSCSVYGASDDLLDEASPLNPVSLYARSKIASESVLFDMAGRTFAPTMLRFGTIYGLSGRSRFDLVVNLLTAKAVTDGKITVFGGDQWRPFVHVEDAARAVAMVLAAPIDAVGNQIFNVGSDDQNATLGDVGRLVQRVVPEADYIDSGRDGDRRNYRVDFSKIRDRLGFTPHWSLEEGVRQVADAILSGKVGDYRDPAYNNVRVLAEGMAPRYARVRRDWAHQRLERDLTCAVEEAGKRSGEQAGRAVVSGDAGSARASRDAAGLKRRRSSKAGA